MINLLFQILDDGVIKDSKGADVKFNNVVIIMTSNAGFNDISVGFNKNIDNISKLKEQFSLPFINRIDDIIYFNSLTEDDIKRIINKKLDQIVDKYSKQIKIKINDSVIKEIISLSNYNEFGARKIDKIIKDKLEDIIIDKLILKKKEITIKTINDKIKV